MGVIDSKGILFGKINIIDLMIISAPLMILAVIISLFFISPEKITMRDKQDYVYVDIFASEKGDSLAGSIEVGDKEYDYDGNMIAEVIEKEIRPRPDGLLDLNLYLKILVNNQNGRWLYKNKELLLGNEIIFKTNETYLAGEIWSIGPKRSEYVTEDVKLVISNAPPYVVDSLNVGDTEKVSNNAVFKIVDKKIRAAGAGTVEIELIAKMLLKKDEKGNLFYQGQNIKVNSIININTQKITTPSSVVSIGKDSTDK